MPIQIAITIQERPVRPGISGTHILARPTKEEPASARELRMAQLLLGAVKLIAESEGRANLGAAIIQRRAKEGAGE